jgi:hypothetical protein
VAESLFCSQQSWIEIFNKKKIFIPGTRRHGGEEPQTLVSVPNLSALNPKSLCSAYGMKGYVLLIVICLSSGKVKPGGPWCFS